MRLLVVDYRMTQSTITDKFQTTIPLAVRVALKLKPRQKVSYEVRPDGSAVLRPGDRTWRPYSAVSSSRNTPSPAARKRKPPGSAMAREAAKEGLS